MAKSPTFYQPLFASGLEELGEEESKHCIRVLRLKKGDHIRIIDGQGLEAECEITNPNSRRCSLSGINSIIHKRPEFKIQITIAPTKQMERIEWFVEKGIEIGIDEITFIECFNSERRSVNLDRIHKKAITSLKQSGNIFLPKINPLQSFTSYIKSLHLQQRFIAYLEDPPLGHLIQLAKKGKNTTVLIGPEGDFSPDEITIAKSKGFIPVSLGNSRLRTETAGINACHILNLINI
jgi:16S rRNA (uracil1498-N3)-methyltransferase